MNRLSIKGRLRLAVLSTLMAFGPATTAWADDTEIYLDPPDIPGSEPLVMLTLEWTPDLNSTWCTAGNCPSDVVALYNDGYLARNPATETIERFDILRGVLKKVFVNVTGIKIGLLVGHDNKNTNLCSVSSHTLSGECTTGGFIPFGFKSMVQDDTNGNKAAFIDLLDRMLVRRPQSSITHTYQPTEMFFELYRYLIGGPIFSGHKGYTSFDVTAGGGGGGSSSACNPDTNGNNNCNLDTEYQYYQANSSKGHPFKWDTTIENGNHYASPLNNSSLCSKIFTINFTRNGGTQGDSDADSEIKQTIANYGLNLPGLSNSAARFNEVLAQLHTLDLSSTLEGTQRVTSYFIVESDINTTQGYAASGGTNAPYLLGSGAAGDVQILVDNLNRIFTEILSISTTFVAASIPVNVFNRSEVLDNVYLALFQPQDTPRWPGNVKKLKIASDANNNLYLADANGQPAIAPDQGRIKFDALTYWTVAGSLPYPDPNVTGAEATSLVTGKDGRFVPRGGAGQKIPGISGSGSTNPGDSNSYTGGRKLYTEPASVLTSAGTTFRNLNANDLTLATTLQTYFTGATTALQAQCLIAYARGYSVSCPTGLSTFSISTSGGSPTPIRTWMFGDPLHSQPQAINYGGTNAGNPNIRIVLGGNDGFFRMIQNTTTGGAETGQENWAFMPLETMGIQYKLAANAANATHPYGVDGVPTVYFKDANSNNVIGTSGADSNDKVWVFFGLRRGGKAYYALDITDPDSPKFKWKITKTTGGNFDQLGMTFSRPQLAMLNWGSGDKPALIFGGGYDATNKDKRRGRLAVPQNPLTPGLDYETPSTFDGEGNALFIVDADTGALIWKAVRSTGLTDDCGPTGSSSTVCKKIHLADSIPADVVTLDADGNNLIDRAYVGDTGGRLWRLDVASTNTANWTLTEVMSVGRWQCNDGVPTTSCPDRRFFHQADLALSSDSSGDFDAVAIGSGDRENPLDKNLAIGDTDDSKSTDKHVPNEFYLFKDRSTVSGSPLSATGQTSILAPSNLADLTDNCLQEGSCTSIQPADTCPSGETCVDLFNGWRLSMEVVDGEKVLATPLILGGNVLFTSYLPPEVEYDNDGNPIITSCSPPEGQGAFYAVNLQTAGATFNRNTANDTTDNPNYKDETDRVRILDSGGIPAEVVTVPTSNLGELTVLPPDLTPEDTSVSKFWKTFWYQEQQ